MAKLTVVIPTYNRPGYLAECLKSIAEQSYRDFALVVLDNASAEDYEPTLSQFAFLGIEYIKNSENIGAVRNIEKAREIGRRTPYHIVFHDDDIMHPGMLECECGVLDENPEMAWVATECKPFASSSTPEFDAKDCADAEAEVLAKPPDLVRRLLENTTLNFGSAMFRSKIGALIKLRTQEFEIIADRVLLCDIAQDGPVGFIRKPLVLYRHHEAQDSHNPIFREQHALALMGYYRRLLPTPLSSADRALVERHSTNYLLHARSTVSPENRMPFEELTREAKGDGLFRWSAIDGQGVAALATLAGVGAMYGAVRPALARIKRSLRG